MTKRQVLCSLRERVDHVRESAERAAADSAKLSDDISDSYYRGRVDAYDLFLEMLSDYD